MNYYQETYGEQMRIKNGKLVEGEKKWMVNKNGKVEGWVYKYPSPSSAMAVPSYRRPMNKKTRAKKPKPMGIKKKNKTQVKRGKNK